ncbi:DoxX family membrane protein [Actinotalea sp. Marseille-Q4924]|uniref:DoxX family membrane protein n=1 Tax=Actinotalea sp. Marseille-Q4924 TaxID=2866571 RepID=UPI001CE3B7FD|nr:DoxX family membrane protein [Actinotalea sp. Marseille-Q4924]
MLVRRIARPLLATAFVADGVDALRHPEAHVDRAEETYRRLSARLDLPPVERRRMTTAVRLHGATVTLAGAALAVGRAPRTAALALALLTVPVAAAHAPWPQPGSTTSGDRPVGRLSRLTAAGSGTSGLDRFLRDLSMIGATLIAAVDLEGRPGLAWRAGHARVDRATTKEARTAVAEARREVRAALKDARRATS